MKTEKNCSQTCLKCLTYMNFLRSLIYNVFLYANYAVLNLLAPELFFLILAHSVYKM